MALYMPLTIDLHKDQNKQYGIEHINRLLEEELKQLRSLKNQKNCESLPLLKPSKHNEIEGLKDYKKRALKTKVEDCPSIKDNSKYIGRKMYVGPFSEFRQEYYREGLVTGKGEVPFFKVNSDKNSVSYRLPRLPVQQNIPDSAGYMNNKYTKQSKQSRKNERQKHSSGKVVRSSGKLLRSDSFMSESENNISDSLRVCYCPLTARQETDNKDDNKHRRLTNNDNYSTTKQFHLACTRTPLNCQPFSSEDRENTFCTGSVRIHTRTSQRKHNVQKGKSTKEKRFLPNIKKDSTPKVQEEKKVCEKCRKRFEQAERNKVTVAVTGFQRKRDTNATVKKVKSKERRVSEKAQEANHLMPHYPHKTEDVAPQTHQTQDDSHGTQQVAHQSHGTTHQTQELEPLKPLQDPEEVDVFECAAYIHDDGTLSLLPGAFFLRNNDYNVWSRNVKTHSIQADLANASCLPRLV